MLSSNTKYESKDYFYVITVPVLLLIVIAPIGITSVVNIINLLSTWLILDDSFYILKHFLRYRTVLFKYGWVKVQCIQCSKGICKVPWVGVSQLLLGPGRSIHNPATLCTVLAWEFRYEHFCKILFLKGFCFKQKRQSILESKTKRCN